MSREAMQQALEDICGAKLCEFNSMSSRHEMVRLMDSAITALRAALAEPEQPVAWRVQRSDGQYELYFLKAAAERAAECYIKRPPVEPLYIAPTPRKPLTDEEIRGLADKHLFYQPEGYEVSGIFNFARAIERKHGIGEQT